MNIYKKYPRTMNCSFSQSNSSDDVWLKNQNHFMGKEVVVSEKLDGEATTMYHDIIHARSIDSMYSHHASRSYVKALHSQIKHKIPHGWRICGESVYAKHAIFYDSLQSYFYVYNVFNHARIVQDWKTVEKVAIQLEFPTVPILYKGIYTLELENKLRTMWPFASLCGAPEAEGFVVRVANEFDEGDFSHNVFKFVKPNHVLPGVEHWMKQQIIPNKLRTE